MPEINIVAPYKYTFPITKAFIGDDGKRRLIGAATGPEVDLEAQRVAKSLIDKWVGQINNGLIEVAYDDNHKTQSESITSELGMIEKAWVDEQDHMMVQILLDDDNPVAQYIHKAASRGKQYGMSIFGKATRFVDEIVSGQRVRTILDGTLERIAHTTRPVWTPSLGTVLSKAVDEATAAESAKGENSVAENANTETPQVPANEGTPATAEGAKAPEAPETPVVVEKAVTADSKKDQKALDKIVSTYATLGAQLKEAGLLPDEAEKSGTAEAEKTVEKAVTEVKAETTNGDVVVLTKAVADLASLVTSLADRIPDGTAPGALRKSEPADPLAELKAVEDPMERLRLGFAAQHGETPVLR